MQRILLFLSCSILYLAKDVTGMSLLRTLIAPNDPPLVRVRSVGQARSRESRAVLDFVGLVEQHSYPAEEHTVTTHDGYQLVLHRIPDSPRANKSEPKRIAFVQHGVIASSDTWVLYGPEHDLPFLLADAGYDVWLGNLRGNTYCRKHMNLSDSDPQFWSFSMDELALIDLPTMIDYALNHTKTEKLYYIGHSMGTTVSYILLSMRPEYNQKMHLVISLSPVAFWNRGISPQLSYLLANYPVFKRILDTNGIYDFAPQSQVYALLGETFCNSNAPTQPICSSLLFLLSGYDPVQFNTTLFPYILRYYPCGTATQVFGHFYQNAMSGKFQMYDYGYYTNMRRYKQKSPPSYDLKNISAPIALFYGLNDAVVQPQNVMELAEYLPNVATVEPVAYRLFTHTDFLWGKDKKELLYDRVMQIMEESK